MTAKRLALGTLSIIVWIVMIGAVLAVLYAAGAQHSNGDPGPADHSNSPIYGPAGP